MHCHVLLAGITTTNHTPMELPPHPATPNIFEASLLSTNVGAWKGLPSERG